MMLSSDDQDLYCPDCGKPYIHAVTERAAPMMLSSDDQDLFYCPECGKPYSGRLDRAEGIAWLIALTLASVALMLVIAVSVRILA